MGGGLPCARPDGGPRLANDGAYTHSPAPRVWKGWLPGIAVSLSGWLADRRASGGGFACRIAKGRRIVQVQTWEDTIVYAGVTHDEFVSFPLVPRAIVRPTMGGADPAPVQAAALHHQLVLAVRRKGKNFYLVLADSAHTPILHFGMSGGYAERGKAGIHYSRPSVATITGEVWPPKYVKLVLRFGAREDGTEGGEGTEWAFCDPRRLARIKLVEGEVEGVPPLSLLGQSGWQVGSGWRNSR